MKKIINKVVNTRNKVKEIMDNITRVNKPSGIGVSLGIHNYQSLEHCMKKLMKLLEWYEPHSIVKKVQMLNLYWAETNPNLAQNLYATVNQIVANSNYAQNILDAAENAHYDALCDMGKIMLENTGNTNRNYSR